MAIFTPVSFDQAVSFVSGYEIGSLQELVPIEGGIENTNYKLITNNAAYILTLFEARTPSEALPFVFDVLRHLAAKNLPVAKPVASKSGDFFQKLNGRTAAIVSFLNGSSTDTPNEKHCMDVGRCLAELHLASDGFTGQRANPFGLDRFEAFYNGITGNLDHIENGLSQLIADEITHLNSQAQDELHRLPSGIIHADFFPDNVLFDDVSGEAPKISGLIDFYYAAIDSFVYDLAITLNCWAGDEQGGLNVEKSKALLRGYESKRALSDVEKKAMNTMLRIASLRFLLSRAHDWFLPTDGQTVAKKDPLEYVRKLKYHQKQQNYEGFGF